MTDITAFPFCFLQTVYALSRSTASNKLLKLNLRGEGVLTDRSNLEARPRSAVTGITARAAKRAARKPPELRNCGCSIRNCKAPGHAMRGSDARRGWSGAVPNFSVATGAGFGEVHGGKHTTRVGPGRRPHPIRALARSIALLVTSAAASAAFLAASAARLASSSAASRRNR